MHLHGRFSRGMAAHAVRNVAGHHLCKYMNPLDVHGIVAVVARVRLIGGGVRVARCAGNNAAPAMVERERMHKRTSLPTVGLMAGGAVFAEVAQMHVILGMTAHTRLRCPAEHVVNMAVFTCHRLVLAGQLER